MGFLLGGCGNRRYTGPFADTTLRTWRFATGAPSTAQSNVENVAAGEANALVGHLGAGGALGVVHPLPVRPSTEPATEGGRHGRKTTPAVGCALGPLAVRHDLG
jgi:hypothetical protein